MAPTLEKDERKEDYFIDLVYGKSNEKSFNQIRFTQDSPILPDVFVHYGMSPKHGDEERLDLLLTPDWSKAPGQVADELEFRLDVRLDKDSVEEKIARAKIYEVAYNQSVVAARLTFEELICYVLPLSWWWQKAVMAVDNLDPATACTDPDRPYLKERIREELRTALMVATGKTKPNTRETVGGLIRPALAWAARVFWVVQFSNREGIEDKPDDDIEGILDYFLEDLIPKIAKSQLDYKNAATERKDIFERLVDQDQQLKTESGEPQDTKLIKLQDAVQRESERREVRRSPWVYQVDRNRDVYSTSWDSASTIKADAATKTFDVRGKGIRWAIIDTGIDARHFAFRRIDKKNGEPFEQAFGEDGSNNTRIKATYDFSNIRSLLSSDAKRSLMSAAGRLVDWERIEEDLGPKFRIPHREWGEKSGGQAISGYRAPVQAHGTHVAGIMGADWRPRDVDVDPLGPPSASTKQQAPFTGLCPEVELYDLRVFDAEGRGDEFAVMSALQFVRSLNQRHDQLEVHGVNMSLAMKHEVSNYACGRTPVCVECARLVGNGVVVVAAAGNEGRSIHTNVQLVRQEGYRLAGIADPGNTEAVITVGSTHRREPHNYGVSYFSSRGPTGDGRLKPDLVAPGEKIDSTVPGDGLAQQDGTSQAAPHVSAAAVLLMCRHTELQGEPVRIKKVLMDSATDLGREKYFQGAGLVDIMRAIQSV